MPDGTTSSDMVIAGQPIGLGQQKIVKLHVTQDLDGGEVAIWVHVVRGAQTGPTLGLFGVQHGDEWKDIDLFMHTKAAVVPAEMKGTLIIVPVCNPVALGTGQRNTQPESDGPDMNRIWPGTHTWLAESMTKVMDKEVLPHCDVVIDFHLGPWGSAFAEVVYPNDISDPALVKRCADLAVAFGAPSIVKANVIQHFPGPRSLLGYAAEKLGKPALVVEWGGGGFGTEVESRWNAQAVRGIKNVMRRMGILSTPLEQDKKLLCYSRTMRVNPSIAGLLIPERTPDELLRPVKKGELLGRIVSPYTFEELEQLVAPCDGWLVYIARSYPVRPGHWAFGVADATTAEWITV